MTDVNCPTCKGTGEISNQEYWDEYDYMEKTRPDGTMIEKELSKRGLTRTIPCPNCSNSK